MEKTYKRVPFDIELAKKIQAGEIEGRIVTYITGCPVRILTYTLQNNLPIVYAVLQDEEETVGMCDKKGYGYNRLAALSIELPKEAPKHEFKPFDKVLVRGGNTYKIQEENIWAPAYFQMYYKPRYEGDNEIYLASGTFWAECIPFAGNENLVGTTNNPE